MCVCNRHFWQTTMAMAMRDFVFVDMDEETGVWQWVAYTLGGSEASHAGTR